MGAKGGGSLTPWLMASLVMVCGLWYSSHHAHWLLEAQHTQHRRTVYSLQALVQETQEHAESVLRLRCNRTALAAQHGAAAGGEGAAALQLQGEIATLYTEMSALRSALFASEQEASDAARMAEEAQQQHAALQATHATSVFAPVASPLSTTHAGGSGGPWLTIGIPTVPRKNNEDYLVRVVKTILHQLPTHPADPFIGRVRVLVMNTHTGPERHARFEEARDLVAREHPARAAAFSFVRDEHLPADPQPGQRDAGSPNKPGYLVRKQTRNIASVAATAAATAMAMAGGGRGVFVFSEDDMELCPHFLRTAHYLLARADALHGDWFAIRASFGMNGIFMRNTDLPVFTSYLLEHQARRPPDHLVTEWMAGETKQAAAVRGRRPHLGFRYNLLDHLGATSTLRPQTRAPSMPRCYDALEAPVVFEVEAFNRKQCPQDDLWPCKHSPWYMKFPQLTPSATLLYRRPVP